MVLFLPGGAQRAVFTFLWRSFALAFSLWLPLSGVEWMLIILCIVLVIVAEVINTSIEKLCNAVHPQFSPLDPTMQRPGECCSSPYGK
ncbi:MAG: diacylglycerol kinase family protein [Taibaiella sp.]|nr:diacylglycerol kinase family protein [Taibaiella sp.]